MVVVEFSKVLDILQMLIHTEFIQFGFPYECPGHEGNTSGNVIVANKGEFYVFPFEQFLIEYIECKLNKKVVIMQEPCETLDVDTPVLCLSSYNMSSSIEQSTIFTPVFQIYMAELLSVLKYEDDLTYFSFTKLFTWKVWLLLLLSLIIITIIMSTVHNSLFSLKLFLELGEYLLGQSSDLIYDIGRNNKMMTTIVIIWLLISTIVKMCFTSLLLGVFFLHKPSLTAETLEELVERPDLKIGGHFSLQDIKNEKRDIYDKLEPRVKEYDISHNYEEDSESGGRPQYLNDLQLVRDLINRKAVFLLMTSFAGVFENLYPGANLKRSDHKYVQRFTYFYASKSMFDNRKDLDTFRVMLNMIVETGWMNKLFNVYETVSEVFAKTDQGWSTMVKELVEESEEDQDQLKLTVVYSNSIICLIYGVTFSTMILICELSYSVRVTS